MKISFSIVLISFAMMVLSGSRLKAQSTVIRTGVDRNQSSGFKQKIPDNLSTIQKQWESILAGPYPGRMPRSLTCGELLSRLRQIGLPVVLDESARDDSLTEDDRLTFQVRNVPLWEMLRPVLKQHNATLMVQSDRISIISLDVSSDPEFFLTVTFNVRSLNVASSSDGRNALMNTIKSAIDPEGWDDTNGDGVIQFTGPELMTVSTTRDVHLEIRRYLYGLLKLQGPASKYAGGPYLESRIVKMPSLSRAERRRRSGRGSGGGGFGGGGGVF